LVIITVFVIPQIFNKLVRRYKYLEKMFEEEMKKVLVFIRGFQPIERVKLARMTALWIGRSKISKMKWVTYARIPTKPS
jgi:hypothetical protein